MGVHFLGRSDGHRQPFLNTSVPAMNSPAQPSRALRPDLVSDPPVSSRELLTQLRRAVDFHLSGDYAGAESLLRAALRSDPSLPQAHHHLAVVLHAQLQYVEAERHLAIAYRLDPHQPGIAERLSAYQADAQNRAA